ncbi:MAG TPA: contractile injection system protein, VgrG/Pvc8 family [Sphingomicrobium sp.]|nr:contractile injection system protein, VgrG/Pvc8 family [Sphingomicrobium sp.]
MPASNVAVLPSRPARPALEIDGVRQQNLEAALLTMECSEAVDTVSRAELIFGNWGGPDSSGFQHFDRKTIEFGKRLVVKLGDARLFEGRITAILAGYPDGGPPTIGLIADDNLQDLRMTRRSRAFDNKSLGDIVRQIAGEHGLTADVSLSGGTMKVVAQVNQSDLALLHDLARREDAQIWLEGTKLRAAKTRPADKVELRWAGSLREFHVEAELAHQRSALVASGWDVAAKTAISQQADQAAISSEAHNLDLGSAILEKAFKRRVDTLAHHVPFDTQEAKAIAEAGYRQIARRFVSGRGVAETRPGLKVGATLALSGLGQLFDGEYRATSVHHLFDATEGQRSEFGCERPGLGRP